MLAFHIYCENASRKKSQSKAECTGASKGERDLRRRLILVAEGNQELGRDQMKNRCNRSLNIPNASDSPQSITQGGKDFSG